MPLSPAAIALIFSNNRTSVLLVKRADVPLWVLPGGGIENGETSAQAVIRETCEETGYHIAITAIKAEYTPVNSLSAYTTLFECKILSGRPIISNESTAIHFFPLDQLPKNLFFIHKNWIKENLHSTTTIYRSLNEINYTSLFVYFLKKPMITLRFLWTRLTKK